jgi:protein-disulfide isomerase
MKRDQCRRLNKIAPAWAILALPVLTMLASCVGSSRPHDLQSEIAATLKAHPELVLDALREEDVALIAMMEQATHKRENQARAAQQHAELNHPLQPDLSSPRPVRGSSNASITIVEYGDFECPFCGQAHRTVREILKRYDGQVRFMHKHNPISEIHPMASRAARWFEAMAEKDPDKAWLFHDRLYEQQIILKDGDEGLESLVASLELNPDEIRNAATSEAITIQIEKDREEARTFGFTGTPAFVINGVSIRGAYPEEEFVRVIELVRTRLNGSGVAR